MADSDTVLDSKKDPLGNSIDPVDDQSTKVLTGSKDCEGVVSIMSKLDEEQKTPIESMEDKVVEGESNLEDSKGAGDNKDEVEIGSNENENSLEIQGSVDMKDQGSALDNEEKKNLGDRQDLKDSVVEEGKGDARVLKEEIEKSSVVVLKGKNDAKVAKDGEEINDAGEAKEIDEKISVEEVMCLEGHKDVNEMKEGVKIKEVGKAMDGDAKSLIETKDKERKKVAKRVKLDDRKTIVLNAKGNNDADVMEDNLTRNTGQALGIVRGSDEKNLSSDTRGTGQNKATEVKDENIVEKSKHDKIKQIEQEITEDDPKTDFGSKNDKKHISKGDTKKKPNDLENFKAENGKKRVIGQNEQETLVIKTLKEDKEGAVKKTYNSKEDDDMEKKSSSKMSNPLKRKRSRLQKNISKGGVKGISELKGNQESSKNAKDLPSNTIKAALSPMSPSRERPVRERKIVERLVEVIEKEPNKAVVIEKGGGTPLKDIPNVANKIARKRPADLKFLHQILFGRRGKAIEFKSNILQFSGFVWHEAEEKQRAKIKEKLDKCVKDSLLDLCDVVDLAISKINSKKEEIIGKLLDFLEAPHTTIDSTLSEKDQSENSRKRKRFTEGSSSRSSRGSPAKKSMKKSTKAGGKPKSKGKNLLEIEDENEEKDAENDVLDEDLLRHSDSDAKGCNSSELNSDDDENDDNIEFEEGKQDLEQSPKKQISTTVEKRGAGSVSKNTSPGTLVGKSSKNLSSHKLLKDKKNDTDKMSKRKRGSELSEESNDDGENEDSDDVKRNQNIKQLSKRQVPSISKKRSKSKKSSLSVKKPAKASSPSKQAKASSPSKQAKVEKDDLREKVFTRKKKETESPKASNLKASVNDNTSDVGKRISKGKTAGEARKSSPSQTDLRNIICEILKEVDFDTATFTDILKKLEAHYKMNLTTKKASIKQMIQEELTKMADEPEDSEDDEKEETATAKGKIPKSSMKKVKP